MMIHLMTTLKMGVKPIDEFLTTQQQQIVNVFRFGTEEEISLIEQSVTINKSKSLGDNPTNQRINYQKEQKKLKKVRKSIKNLNGQIESDRNVSDPNESFYSFDKVVT